METFIQISKHVRNRYTTEVPFIAAMCKRPQREDVSNLLVKLLAPKPADKETNNK